MRILAFDLETTGLLEDEKAMVTEIGWAVWDTVKNRVTAATSYLVNDVVKSDNPTVSEKIQELTGIDSEMLKTDGASGLLVLPIFNSAAERCDAYMTRNGIRFDWPMLGRLAAYHGLKLVERPIIDDYLDIDYPPTVKGTSLSYVAADHGFLNPFPHSALGDTMTLIRVMQLGGYNMEKAFESAMTPVVEVRACVSFDDKELAKERNFKWDPERKVWWKQMRECRYAAEEYPFKTEMRRVF